jgi:hypothetical protein
VQNRSRAVGRRLRLIGRTVGRRLGRAGGARAKVLELTGQAGELLARSIREARALAAQARKAARGRGAQAKLAAARRLDRQAELAEKVCRQITQRLAGERITDRLVSLADPDARPIGKGKLGKPYEFGYVFQLAELTPNTRRGARGLILPAASQLGSPNESELLPATAAELERLGLRPREVALDGGFPVDAANQHFPDANVFVAGRQHPASRRSKKRLASYRAGSEGRISHLKRAYGLRRSRLRATTARARGPALRSWPTTSTRSPSTAPDTLPRTGGGTPPAPTTNTQRRPRRPRGRFISRSLQPRVLPGQIASSRCWSPPSSNSETECSVGLPYVYAASALPGAPRSAKVHKRPSCRKNAGRAPGGCASRISAG